MRESRRRRNEVAYARCKHGQRRQDERRANVDNTPERNKEGNHAERCNAVRYLAMNNWSTPSAHDGRRPGSDDTSTQGRNLKREAEGFLAYAEHAVGGGNLMATPKHTGGIDLEGAAELWQTPAVDSFRSRGGDRKDEMGLDQQARIAWVTPASRDWKGANSEIHVTETGGGRRHMDQLSNQVEHSFPLAQQTESSGQPSSETAPTSRRRLNTKFVEWLQGLPEGWTSPAPISSEALEIWLSASRAHLHFLRSSKGVSR